MSKPAVLKHHDVILRPDPSRTVVRPFGPGYPSAFQQAGHSRADAIVARVTDLDDAAVGRELQGLTRSLDERHRDVDAMLMRRFDDLAADLHAPCPASDEQKRLIGAYFSEEYSYEAAALFNPSAIITQNQDDVPEGSVHFAMSLRGIGEGHVSSVTFRTGLWTPGQSVEVYPPSPTSVAPIVKSDCTDGTRITHLECSGSEKLSETVIFPILPSQRQGIEDLRLVRFAEDDGSTIVYGTYTAFSGSEARSELLRGLDHKSFTMQPLTGSAAAYKGMALFPRKVRGRYMMLGRQDSESIWLHSSDSVTHWEGGSKIVSPHYPWEFVQMGNCGSPIEVDEGWLVLTHGVGTVRNYCMGACLLDKDDPSKLLARTPQPILEPSPNERDGYVPNVVYSCGALAQGRDVLIPYGVADNFTAFASTTVDDLLGAME